MFGIANTPTNLDQFLIALYSGLISGMVTGLIVGLAIWIIQSRFAKRQVHQQSQREVATFRERLRLTLNQAQTTSLTVIIDEPPLARAFANILADIPLELWKDNVQEQQDFFKAVDNFQAAYADFITAKNKILASARGIIRNYNSKLGKVIDYDSAGLLFFLGRVLDFDDKSILPWLWIGVSDDSQLPYFTDLYNTILADTATNALISPYVDQRKHIEQTIELIRAMLH